MEKTFKSFVEEVVRERYDGVSQRLADALGITLSALLRGVDSGALATRNLLKLAAVSGAHPSAVLRSAGKGETAELIEQLYGRAREPMSNFDRQILHLPLKAKKHLWDFVETVMEQKQ